MPLLETFHTIVRGVLGLGRVALHTDPASGEAIAHRRRLCAMCDSATHRKSTGMPRLMLLSPTSACSVCKCNIRAKTSLAGEFCPLGKWQREDVSQAADGE